VEEYPMSKRKTMGNNYPKEIRELIAEKRRARKRWQQTRIPADKTRLNSLSLQLKREIQEVMNESISSYLRKLKLIFERTNKRERDRLFSMEGDEKNAETNSPIRKEDCRWAKR
jgi:predicted house-cleaning noncanonical NTP pyrophosphatase (MazG superfamily)